MRKEQITKVFIKNGLISIFLCLIFWCPTTTEKHSSEIDHEEIGHIKHTRGSKSGDYIDINSTQIHCNAGLASRGCPNTYTHFKIGESERVYKAKFIKYNHLIGDDLIFVELSFENTPLYGYSRTDLAYFRNYTRIRSNMLAIFIFIFSLSFLTWVDWKKSKNNLPT